MEGVVQAASGEHREPAVTHINLDTQEDAVKKFFLALPNDPQGSVLELNGRAFARVLPVGDADEDTQDDDEWTEAKNERRCVLIDKEIDGTLTAEEAAELQQLQRAMLRYRRRVAPLPLEDARRLHQELLAKAGRRNGGA
jgi:hypothetical protein